jgi:hypothetical protein
MFLPKVSSKNLSICLFYFLTEPFPASNPSNVFMFYLLRIKLCKKGEPSGE